MSISENLSAIEPVIGKAIAAVETDNHSSYELGRQIRSFKNKFDYALKLAPDLDDDEIENLIDDLEEAADLIIQAANADLHMGDDTRHEVALVHEVMSQLKDEAQREPGSSRPNVTLHP
jgi:hypothetical protein